MPRRMRLIDSAPIEAEFRKKKELYESRGDTRAVKMLEYALSILEDAPEVPMYPDTEKMKRKKYGRYKNVLLSEADVQTLETELPGKWRKLVEDVSEYVAESGKTYKNFLAVIRNWARRDAEKEEEKQPAESSFETDEFEALARRRTYGEG